jgi:hypothetical protein
MAVTIEQGAWTVVTREGQFTHYEPQIQGDKLVITISAQGHHWTSGAIPLTGDTDKERRQAAVAEVAALIKSLHNPWDLVRRQVVQGRIVIRCYACEGEARSLPDKGLGRAHAAAWETQHQHLEG